MTRNDFVIIDFEGEPGRDFEARRAKQSSLRDIAGMLRSFSYAQQSALRANVVGSADETKALAAALRDWEAQARRAFLEGYAANAEARLWSGDALAPEGLLALYVLEKALYELRYELGNRPDWIDIPLEGLLATATIEGPP